MLLIWQTDRLGENKIAPLLLVAFQLAYLGATFQGCGHSLSPRKAPWILPLSVCIRLLVSRALL